MDFFSNLGIKFVQYVILLIFCVSNASTGSLPLMGANLGTKKSVTQYTVHSSRMVKSPFTVTHFWCQDYPTNNALLIKFRAPMQKFC